MKFYQITDLHFYPAKAMKACGDEWIYRTTYDQKCIAESEAILDSTIELLLADKEIDIIFITGDNVCDGERAGHYELQKKLRKLTNAGKRVFIITGTHDLHPQPLGYSKEKGEYQVEGCTRDELIDIYKEFGYDDAVATHHDTFSYVSKLDDTTRLIALNDDGIGFEDGFHGYFEDQLGWIKEQLEEGKKSGDKMLVITHHPLLAPSPFYEFYSKNQMLGNCDEIRDLFADYGVQFVFTGHSHMHNINYYDSEKGNRIYDINTASLIAYPSPIRRFELTDTELKVETLHITKLDFDLKSMSYMEYSKNHFDYMLKDILYSAAHDFEHFCVVAEGFSLHEEQSRKLRVPITILGKVLDTLTFKKAGKLLMCTSKIAPRMYNVRLCDFIIDLIRNIYAGDEPYYPGSAEYDSFMAIYNRFAPILHKLLGSDEIDNVIKGVLYDDGFPDSNAVLPVIPFKN
ncbi:MAG: metallophosphoesterase [Acetobacter sp.]|nr:metallophosphoesterase [Bacteroides sp.]MCM1341537.1 metallophosphoesterase [Acetobacter sp.]MCM1433614.1 metallophosphoesterase [Clostridiales bacterium]